ncbi:MAG: alpha-xylosidase, partial [Bacteroidaceae bacterium]|nr:alpha-xylosidase [Bacteroidaceae bacterium]
MQKRVSLFLLTVLSVTTHLTAQLTTTRINPTTFEIRSTTGPAMTLDFYGTNIVRLFFDPAGGAVRDPEATPPAQILVTQPRRATGELTLEESDSGFRIQSSQLTITINRTSGQMDFTNRHTNKQVTSLLVPTSNSQEASVFSGLFNEKGQATISLTAHPEDAFYGGGVQNGRYSHGGTVIAIENTNNWVDGGVASPTPFYWSTAGYGILWHTFRPGKYDFGSTDPSTTTLTHEEAYLDVFLMVDNGCVALLNDFYQLTGHPVLLPKFGFYEGHLNAYNRDYWQPLPDSSEPDASTPEGALYGPSGSVIFEDGRCYKESQKPVDDGIRESLNGELDNNYQFSARAVVDRYERADMPLGWVLPNDGYGAGYGQTSSLEGNIENLRQFGEYARSKGVEIGLWTQ